MQDRFTQVPPPTLVESDKASQSNTSEDEDAAPFAGKNKKTAGEEPPPLLLRGRDRHIYDDDDRPNIEECIGLSMRIYTVRMMHEDVGVC